MVRLSLVVEEEMLGQPDEAEPSPSARPGIDLPVLRRLMRAAEPGHRTASGVVTETLRTAIIQGAIPAGTALRQNDLAAALGISRMPVREAIRQLEGEGLVDFAPHRGAVVATLLPDDAVEISELRVALEQLALRLSLPHLDTAAFDRADTILTAIDAEQSVAKRAVLNRHFHAVLYSGVNRPRLGRQIASLYDAFDRYLRFEHSQLERHARSQQEHRRILDACRRGNMTVALGELASHIGDAGDQLAALLRSRIKAG